MDQPIPAFYLQLEKTIQKVAESIKLQGKTPFLTHKELRYDRVLMYNNDLANLHYITLVIGKQYSVHISRY